MQENFKISMLLDYYGKLITARQYEIIDMYFNEDCSLGEIAEQLAISRQGVYDNIRKGSALLNEFENKLGLVAKYNDNKTLIRNIEKEIDDLLDRSKDKEILNKLVEIKNKLKHITEN